MGEKNIEFDSARLASVWKRVTGSPAAGTSAARSYAVPADTQQMKKHMDAEASASAYYRALAGKTSGRERQILLNIAADELKHLQKLKTAYFMLTGSCHNAAAKMPEIKTVSDALRTQYQRECDSSETYGTAADSARRRDISSMYRRFSEDEARHAELISGIIKKLI